MLPCQQNITKKIDLGQKWSIATVWVWLLVKKRGKIGKLPILTSSQLLADFVKPLSKPSSSIDKEIVH